MMTKADFFNKVDELRNQTISSKSGRSSYSNIIRKNNLCSGIRSGSSKTPFEFNLDDIYRAYTNRTTLNTTSLKDFLGNNRCRSAALAIMMASKLLDEYGNTLK